MTLDLEIISWIWLQKHQRKKINIAKFQKVESFFVCVIQLYTQIIFEIIFHYKLL